MIEPPGKPGIAFYFVSKTTNKDTYDFGFGGFGLRLSGGGSLVEAEWW